MTGFLVSLVGQRFWIPAYICMAVGMFLPGDYRYLGDLIPWSLGAILFFTCLKIPFNEIATAVRDQRRLRQLSWMVPFKLLVLPALGWAVTWLIAPEWAPGIALACLTPVGMSTTALTDLHSGDRILALLLTAATSLLAPLTIPMCMAFMPHGVPVTLDLLAKQTVYLLLLIAAPFIAAQVVRRIAPRVIANGMAWWGRLAMLSLHVLILCASLVNHDAWASWSPLRMLIPIGLCCLVSLIIFVAVLRLRPWLSRPELTALACGALYMNNGLGLAYASKFYPGDAHFILPAIVMGIPMLAAIALWGRWAHVPTDEPAA
ncbi:MAG: bile acid:sodium symporter [Planctomycetota bacterium]